MESAEIRTVDGLKAAHPELVAAALKPAQDEAGRLTEAVKAVTAERDAAKAELAAKDREVAALTAKVAAFEALRG